MAKASGGTRTKYPNKTNTPKQGKFKLTRQRSTAPGGAQTEIEKITDAEFEELNAQITKILKDANVSLDNAQIVVSDITNSFTIKSKGIDIERSVYPGKEMHHSWFKIGDKNARGKNVSKAIHRALIPLYEKMGIKKITVHAALENGGYTWAQYGFRVERYETSWVIAQMSEKYSSRAQEIVNNFYETHPTSDKFPMYLISRKEWGKAALSGLNWEGDIDLTDPVQRKDFYDYCGYKG